MPAATATPPSLDPASDEAEALAGRRQRQTIAAAFAMMLYQGYAMAINAIASPWIARSFALDEGEMARLFAWIATSAIGALIISRMSDRIGRRRVLLLCMTATPVLALLSALSESLTLFTVFQIGFFACITATVSSSVVLLAEGLPIHLRARGQSFGGLALGLGGGVCVVLVPILSAQGLSWRWLLYLASGGVLLLPALRRLVPESERWASAAAAGSTSRSSFYGVFGPRYRRRAVPILICHLLSMTAVTAVTSWGYFHAVSVRHLSPSAASLMIITGGVVSFLGLSGGAWSAERFGRVPTIAAAGLLLAGGGMFFYWGPPHQAGNAFVWLAAGFCLFMIAVNAWMVAGNSAATELFPTALRTTMLGWLALVQAIAAVSSQAIIALTAAAAGGLSVVVGYLALLGVPSAILCILAIEETRGLSLEDAAKETVE